MRLGVILSFVVVTSAVLAATVTAAPVEATFTLLAHPDVVGHKPSGVLPTTGDWLIGTGDDDILPAANNPAGAFSHNFADLGGAGGAGFNLAPSLAGTLTMQLTTAGGTDWNVSITNLAYLGQAAAVMSMNQYLVGPGSPATHNPTFAVDGIGNNGLWQGSGTGNWAISYGLDFYFATNADGNPSPDDIDAAFNDKLQIGFLIPTSALTPAGLSGLALDDAAGFHAGDLQDYLLNVVAPRLPNDATYLLFTQMLKTSPNYAEPGIPIGASALIGNTTIAYTTAVIPEPASLVLLAAGASLLLRRRTAFGL